MVTLYGVPKTLADTARWAWRSPIGDVLWVSLISVLLVYLGYFFYLLHPFLGGFFASIILGSLWRDEVRSTVRDIMLRRWANL